MKHLVLVLTEPVAGRDDEFNAYYEGIHLDEVLQTTGWVAAQRFKLVDQAGPRAPHQHLAIYEVEGDEGEDVLKKLNATRPQRQQSDALNRKTASAWVFAENGPRHT